MKVLFLQNIEGIGGSENYLIKLLPGLKKAGIECEMLSVIPLFRKGDQGTSDDFKDKLEAEGIVVHEIRTTAYVSPFLIYKIRKIYLQGGFDILHSHLIYADFWAAWVKLLTGKKVKLVSTKHGYQEKIYSGYSLKPNKIPKNLYYQVFRFSEQFMDQSYACSKGLSDFLEQAGLVKDLAVVEHGFEYSAISEDLEPYKFGEIQVVLPGRLIYRKGHDLFFKIMPALLESFPTLRAVIIGEGSHSAKLQEQIEEYSLEEYVLFKGFQSNPLDWMAASDVVVVPSRSEGLPLVIMEAFRSGTPVVAFAVPGCKDAIADGFTGRIVPAFELDQFREAIETLINDKELANEISRNAKRELETRFSYKRMISETVEVYRNIGLG